MFRTLSHPCSKSTHIIVILIAVVILMMMMMMMMMMMVMMIMTMMMLISSSLSKTACLFDLNVLSLCLGQLVLEWHQLYNLNVDQFV